MPSRYGKIYRDIYNVISYSLRSSIRWSFELTSNTYIIIKHISVLKKSILLLVTPKYVSMYVMILEQEAFNV